MVAQKFLVLPVEVRIPTRENSLVIEVAAKAVIESQRVGIEKF
jgi:hypothetical protein